MSEASWKKKFYPIDADLVDEEDAIKHSLVKWYGLRKENLKNHGLSEPPIYIDADTCALCHHYDNGFDSCWKCPLYQFLGRSCASGVNGGEYYCYMDYGDPEPMIAALEMVDFIERTCK